MLFDDAHGFGVLGEGRGSVAAAGLESDRIVVMGTLGKAAGVAGADPCSTSLGTVTPLDRRMLAIAVAALRAGSAERPLS